MLKAEWRKVWSRGSARIFLAALCLAQAVYVYTAMPAGTASSGGYECSIPDDTWNKEFTAMLDDHIAGLKSTLATDPGYDLSRIDAAYAGLRAASENAELESGASPAAEGMMNQAMVNWGFVLFLLFFAVNQLTAETSTGMPPLLCVSRRGRRELLSAKFTVFQLSALLVWFAENLTFAAVLTVRYGWGCITGTPQDFVFNTSPYVWNYWQVTAVVLCCSLLTGQIMSAVVFCLVRLGRNTVTGFCLAAGAAILPLIFAVNHPSVWTSLMLPCLMQNSWMWSAYREFRFGRLYLLPWQIAAAELFLAALAAGIWIWKREKSEIWLEERRDVSV